MKKDKGLPGPSLPLPREPPHLSFHFSHVTNCPGLELKTPRPREPFLRANWDSSCSPTGEVRGWSVCGGVGVGAQRGEKGLAQSWGWGGGVCPDGRLWAPRADFRITHWTRASDVLCRKFRLEGLEARMMPVTRWEWGLTGLRTHYRKIRHCGTASSLSWRSLRKQQTDAGRSFWPRPQTSALKQSLHKTLMWETASLFQEERGTLISEDKGVPRGSLIGRSLSTTTTRSLTSGFPPGPPTPSHSHTTHMSVSSRRLHVTWNLDNVHAVLLSICPCQSLFSDPARGSKDGRWNVFLLKRPH